MSSTRDEVGERVGRRRPLEQPMRGRALRPWCRRPASSMRRIGQLRLPRSRHVSRNVPLRPRPSSSVPHGTPSAARRCSRRDRRTAVRRAQVELDRLRVADSGFSRAAALARRRGRGPAGPAAPRRAPRRWRRRRPARRSHQPGSPPSTGVGGVEHLGQPGPRSVAQRGQRRRRARVAAIRWSGEAGMPRRRRACAASTKNRVTPSGPGWRNTWAYQPGLSDAGAVARSAAAEPAMRPRHPRDADLDLRAGRGSVARVGGRRGDRVGSSAGTCHAPHTTATDRRRRRARARMRLAHVRLARGSSTR